MSTRASWLALLYEPRERTGQVCDIGIVGGIAADDGREMYGRPSALRGWVMSRAGDPVRRHLLATRHGFVHVREAGSGKVPLLLLHMSPLSSHMWDTMLPLMSTDRRVLAPDRIGFGDSDRLTRPIQFHEYAGHT
jgi:hypothetical protein